MLYGTTSAGGANGRGTIFRIAFDGSRFEVLRTFDAATADATTGLLENTCAAVPENTCGAAPLAGLIDGGDSRYYGVASAGGATGNGVLFAITADGTYTVLHEFDGSNGSRPVGELLLGSDGKLYGSTAGGGQTSGGAASTFGTLFSISRDGTGFTRLYNFDGTKGAAPVGKLIELSNGVFAGTAANNGSCGFGTIYRYSATGDTVTGNTRCGRKKNDNGYGGGAGGPALLLLLGGLACLRQRRH
jgi:uncharacterized repeat protein (TIGR03803 family)